MSQMLYKPGKEIKWEGLLLDTLIVSEADIDSKLAEGWRLTPFDAYTVEHEPADDKSPPTRAEMEQKATELGLKFDGRTTDQKLAKLIEEALK